MLMSALFIRTCNPSNFLVTPHMVNNAAGEWEGATSTRLRAARFACSSWGASFRGRRQDGDATGLEDQCRARRFERWAGMAGLAAARPRGVRLVDQAMAPTPWCGRQIAPRDRAAKPTGVVQTSIAQKGILT